MCLGLHRAEKGRSVVRNSAVLSLNLQQPCVVQMSNVGYRWGHTLNSCPFTSM